MINQTLQMLAQMDQNAQMESTPESSQGLGPNRIAIDQAITECLRRNPESILAMVAPLTAMCDDDQIEEIVCGFEDLTQEYRKQKST